MTLVESGYGVLRCRNASQAGCCKSTLRVKKGRFIFIFFLPQARPFLDPF